MNELSREVAQRFRDGAHIGELIRHIRHARSVAKPGEGRFVVVACLVKAFGLPIATAKELGRWEGFEDRWATLSDTEVERRMRPVLEAALRARDEAGQV